MHLARVVQYLLSLTSLDEKSPIKAERSISASRCRSRAGIEMAAEYVLQTLAPCKIDSDFDRLVGVYKNRCEVFRD